MVVPSQANKVTVHSSVSLQHLLGEVLYEHMMPVIYDVLYEHMVLMIYEVLSSMNT